MLRAQLEEATKIVELLDHFGVVSFEFNGRVSHVTNRAPPGARFKQLLPRLRMLIAQDEAVEMHEDRFVQMSETLGARLSVLRLLLVVFG